MVEGGVQVFDQGGRNPNTIITRRNGEIDLFVKQYQSAEGKSECDTELAFYEFHQSDYLNKDNSTPLAPRCILYSHDEQILVLEYFGPPASPLSSDFSASLVTPKLAMKLGFLIANIQALPKSLNGLNSKPPWIMSVNQPQLNDLLEMSPATTELVAIIQRDIDLLAVISILRDQWKPECLVHGDLKWANVIELHPGRSDLMIIDWETASYGDRYWDISGVAAGFFLSWLLSIPANATGTSELAQYPLRSALEGVAALLREFESQYSISQSEIHRDRLIIQFAGLRLIQFCIELSQGHSKITHNIALALQFARNCVVSHEVTLRGLYEDANVPI